MPGIFCYWSNANGNLNKSLSKDQYEDVKFIYQILVDLVMQSETVRWNRLNNILLINSLLTVAWVTIFTSKCHFEFKSEILTVICILGILFGLIWAPLGFRSSKHVDTYRKHAELLEEYFTPPLPRPFQSVKSLEKSVIDKILIIVSSSTTIVTYAPLLFVFVFLFLISMIWKTQMINFLCCLL